MRQFYVQTIEFNDNIAPGAQSTKYAQIDTGGWFVCESMVVTAWIPTAQASAIAGTPLSPASSPTAANNTFIHLAHLRLRLNVAGVDWFSNAIRCSAFGPGMGSPSYFQTKPVLGALNQLTGTLFNDAAATFTVQAQVALFGYRTTDRNDW